MREELNELIRQTAKSKTKAGKQLARWMTKHEIDPKGLHGTRHFVLSVPKWKVRLVNVIVISTVVEPTITILEGSRYSDVYIECTGYEFMEILLKEHFISEIYWDWFDRAFSQFYKEQGLVKTTVKEGESFTRIVTDTDMNLIGKIIKSMNDPKKED
jgi:hypothetical protein